MYVPNFENVHDLWDVQPASQKSEVNQENSPIFIFLETLGIAENALWEVLPQLLCS